MDSKKIDSLQLFCLIIIFEFGSSALLDVGKEAGRSSWIVPLLGTVLGCVLYGVYTALFRYYPALPLTGYVSKILGKYIGSIVAALYILYFMYITARVTLDFSGLLVTTVYKNSSVFLVSLLMLISIAYVTSQGLQAIGRFSILCFIITALTIVGIVALEIVEKLPEPVNLLPILDQGWQPIIQELLPKAVTVPFGEMIAFTMIFPVLKNAKKARKTGIFALIVSGLYLSFSLALHTSILGEDVMKRAIFPVLSAVTLIDIGHFLTRLEVFVINILVILGFFKILLFFYCAVIGLADLIQTKNKNRLIIPCALVVFILVQVIQTNYVEHLYIGFNIVPYYLHLPFQIIIPTVLLLIVIVKNKLRISKG
ncbi:GerAB/ArcD/ProY family transporter [Peribacillus muralis]|uniref:GerAB/ArcD/ProY family transporter n=1 Tax=Peribacillus muralis TaxID=264697 RepID=UPI00366E3DA9